MARKARSTPPIIDAPPVVVAVGLAIIGAHALRALAPAGIGSSLLMSASLQPRRVWATLGLGAPGAVAYGNPVEAILPLLTEALVHDGWGAALLNAALVVMAGRPVHAAVSRGRRGAMGRFLSLFTISVLGGSLAHLILGFPSGPALIGASGGVCGLLGALVLKEEGSGARILSARFLTVLGVFAAVNLAVAVMGPSLLGFRMSWQAHIGGFLAGAVAFAALRPARGAPRF